METRIESVNNIRINWKNIIILKFNRELTDTSKELRIMLCKEKPKDGSAAKRGTSVVAACGT